MNSNSKKTEKKALVEIAMSASHLIYANKMEVSENDDFLLNMALLLLAEILINHGYIGTTEDGPQFYHG